MLRNHSERSASRVEESWRETDRNAVGSLDFARDDKTRSRELFQKSQIVLREQPDIRYFEQNHCQPIHSEAKCVAAPFFRIVSIVTTRFVDSFKNGWMDQAAARHLDPLFSTLESF